MAEQWRFRGLQLDLARQMEPVSRICELIDLSADSGLTHVQLYLEGRVRLPCFPGPLDGGAYGAEELTVIAEHARTRGIQLTPVISGLAHAEQIVTRPEFTHLAEEREGRGRFHAGLATLCPSLPETRVFLQQFTEQLCALLPGTELHLGCDEPWNLGYCSHCNLRAKNSGLGSIYVDHVRWLHGLAAGLGRRLWLWDDFLEVFPEAIDQLPADICWNHWNYDEAIDLQGTQAHFTNRRRHRWLELYARRNMEAVVVPWALAPLNVESLLAHGRRHPAVVGSILSEWEMAWRGWDERRTVVRAFGALCRREDPDTAWNTAIAVEAPELTASQIQVAKSIVRQLREPLNTHLNAFLKGPLSPTQHDRLALNALALATLPLSGSSLVHGLRVAAELDQLTLGLQQWLQLAYDPRLPHDEVQKVQSALRQLQGVCARIGPAEDLHLRQQRPGCQPQGSIGAALLALGEIIQNACNHLADPPAAAAMLVVRYVLPDGHGAPRLTISLQDDAQDHHSWREIYAGSPKPDPRSPGSYATQIAVLQTVHPQRLRISGGGYGGIAVCWGEIITATSRWVMHEVTRHEGRVDQPMRLLSDDSWCCHFGDDDILAQLLNIPHAPPIGTVEGLLVDADLR